MPKMIRPLMDKTTFITSVLAVALLAGIAIGHAETLIPDNDRAKLGMAKSLNNLKKYEEAGTILEDLNNRYPEDKEIAFECAKALGYGKKNTVKAYRLLERLRAQQPQDTVLGEAYLAVCRINGDVIKEKEYLEGQLKQCPQDQQALSRMTELLIMAKDYRAAANYLERRLEADPSDRTLRIQRADVLFWDHRYTEAARDYEKAGLTASDDAKTMRNLGFCYLETKRTAQAVSVFSSLADKDPADLESRRQLCYALLSSGRGEEAEKKIRQFVRDDPSGEAMAFLLIDLLSARGDFAGAVEEARRLNQKAPDSPEAQLRMARVLSWNRNYAESLEVYEKLIRNKPAWALPRRERARVLGWDRKYPQAVQAYEETVNALPDDGPSRLELEAKRNFYYIHDQASIEAYQRWLSGESESHEAVFDLAQVYSRQSQWENARRFYEKMLALNPFHSKARLALKKVEQLSRATLWRAGFKFFEAGSSERLTDVRYFQYSGGAELPIHEAFRLGFMQDSYLYSFVDLKDVTRQRSSFEVSFLNKPYLWAEAGYAFSLYSGSVENSHNFHETLHIKPQDAWELVFSHSKEDVIDNSRTLRDHLQKDDFRFRARYEVTEKIFAGGDYTYSHYNDDNDRQNYGFDVKTDLMDLPKRLSLGYRYEAYGFDASRPTYFSPGSFHTNILTAEWEHYLNQEELCWGSNDTVYTLRYSVSFDVHEQTGHTLFAGLRRDWTDRLSTRCEWSKTLYEDRRIYGEERVMVTVTYSF